MFQSSDVVTSISFAWFVMALPQESHSSKIQSKSKSAYKSCMPLLIGSCPRAFLTCTVFPCGNDPSYPYPKKVWSRVRLWIENKDLPPAFHGWFDIACQKCEPTWLANTYSNGINMKFDKECAVRDIKRQGDTVSSYQVAQSHERKIVKRTRSKNARIKVCWRPMKCCSAKWRKRSGNNIPKIFVIVTCISSSSCLEFFQDH